MENLSDSPSKDLNNRAEPDSLVIVTGGANIHPVPEGTSPHWSPTTKLVIGLTLAGISVFLVFRFLNILGPLLLAFILAYLFYPMAEVMKRKLHLPWRLGVTLLYLVLVLMLLGSTAAGGLAIVEQIQSLIRFLQNAITNLPETLDTLVSNPFAIGPFVFYPNALDMDVNTLTQQVLGVVQPLLTGAGALVGTFASSAAVVVGWVFFILLISYFILAESGGFPNLITHLDLPGYDFDSQRMSSELGRIWNAFLRGQLTIVLMTILLYTFVLGALGVNFFFGLALLAGLARFIPYVGPAITWTTYGLVAFFQGTTLFGIPPLGYVGLVVGVAWFMDMIMDNAVAPRVMADALRVHPAAVMVSALIGVNLLGVIGVVLAAPVLATVQLFFNYIVRKLLDQDPWAGMQTISPSDTIETLVPKVQERTQVLVDRITHAWRPRQK
jgi:predicted PurR-regulated permease PerM